ncbi:SURF1 family cytochrome oxidase biogenesis protein [Candidatus Aalborgicola defluviihabitans]|uniref:SURF1 family cytochrome oxidase biogenesis protein n=1 Tax=Candidatus Aalborgicola defluviihabitans TaxID=3386187 RepID=UPI001ECAB1BB|nr:hypothetical protein [Burkholderiales bacterium]
MDGRMGFIVLMPFALEGVSGSALVVQRGWVPRGLRTAHCTPDCHTGGRGGNRRPHGAATIRPVALGAPTVGAIRQNLYLPQWKLETGCLCCPLRCSRWVPMLMGCRDWPAVNLGVEKNYGYAIQWFGMASVFVVLYVWFQIIRRFFIRPRNNTPNV